LTSADQIGLDGREDGLHLRGLHVRLELVQQGVVHPIGIAEGVGQLALQLEDAGKIGAERFPIGGGARFCPHVDGLPRDTGDFCDEFRRDLA
jgi:hypothetical protein